MDELAAVRCLQQMSSSAFLSWSRSHYSYWLRDPKIDSLAVLLTEHRQTRTKGFLIMSLLSLVQTRSAVSARRPLAVLH